MAETRAQTTSTYEFAARRERLAPASWRSEPLSTQGQTYAQGAAAPARTKPHEKPAPAPSKQDKTADKAKKNTETLKWYYIGISRGSKFAYLMLISALALLFGVIIAFSAYRSAVQDGINTAKQETAALKTEIRDLSIRIESSKIIGNIEYKAAGELEMIYPAGAQIVYNAELDTENAEALLAKLEEMAHGEG